MTRTTNHGEEYFWCIKKNSQAASQIVYYNRTAFVVALGNFHISWWKNKDSKSVRETVK